MSFLEHLEELRWCIIRILIALAIGTILAYLVSENILDLFTHYIPEDITLRTLKPTEGFATRLRLAFTTGIFIALPYLLYQVWKFITPGLLASERKYLLPFLFFGSIIFIVGSLFAYLIVLPIAINFLHSFQTEKISDAWAIGEYIAFATRMLIVFGIIFELPLITFILSKLGIVTPHFLATKRKYAILTIFVVAAILTPPDIFTQSLMALPLIILYEISILISKFAVRK